MLYATVAFEIKVANFSVVTMALSSGVREDKRSEMIRDLQSLNVKRSNGSCHSRLIKHLLSPKSGLLGLDKVIFALPTIILFRRNEMVVGRSQVQ